MVPLPLTIYNGFTSCSDLFHDLESDLLKKMCLWMYMYFACPLASVPFKYDRYNLLLICNFHTSCSLSYLCPNLSIKPAMIDSCHDSLSVLPWTGAFLTITLDNWGVVIYRTNRGSAVCCCVSPDQWVALVWADSLNKDRAERFVPTGLSVSAINGSLVTLCHSLDLC